ncbi:hypothetical protein TNCT_122021 [Trichonephila clavata]|uniref:Uncharacterized protein n=1 Tax=Trichonephila clavata TaxID=2740835 RepID=A0A8X6M0B6_TRICU|nr:hypothetical protein TNCT_122021 [Trichonephila clavata]
MPIRFFFRVLWSVGGRPNVCRLFGNSNSHALCCMLNDQNPTAFTMLPIVTLRSARINSPTCCSVDFVAIKTGRLRRSSSTILEWTAKILHLIVHYLT